MNGPLTTPQLLGDAARQLRSLLKADASAESKGFLSSLYTLHSSLLSLNNMALSTA